MTLADQDSFRADTSLIKKMWARTASGGKSATGFWHQKWKKSVCVFFVFTGHKLFWQHIFCIRSVKKYRFCGWHKAKSWITMVCGQEVFTVWWLSGYLMDGRHYEAAEHCINRQPDINDHTSEDKATHEGSLSAIKSSCSCRLQSGYRQAVKSAALTGQRCVNILFDIMSCVRNADFPDSNLTEQTNTDKHQLLKTWGLAVGGHTSKNWKPN